MKHTTVKSQRGAAALVVTLMLFLALALASLGLHRHLIAEQRAAANQARATQAFEAAEAGLEWALAQLNSTQRIGADCQPDTDPAATTPTFRERYLTLDRTTGTATPTGRQGSCVRTVNGWSCSCPASGPVMLAAPVGNEPTPSFNLRFQPTTHAGAVRISADGCTSLAGACAAGSASTADATAHAEATLALFAGLRHPPTLALTTRDAASQTPDQFFAAFFGIDKPTWQSQSVVALVACGADCGHAIGEAIAAGSVLIRVEGDLTLTGPLALGSAAHPVVIVASGGARLDGGVTIVGALYATSVTVSGTGTLVQGAVINEGSYAGPAAPDFRLDADVLAALAHQTGSFARVSGSWRDF
ncbi:MAG: PilX N-terminal domain-containing pilus assembly protein [Burkholderiales bacterium]